MPVDLFFLQNSRSNTTQEKVTELKETLYKKRGEAAVTRLVEEMRKQWGRRHEWLGRDNG